MKLGALLFAIALTGGCASITATGENVNIIPNASTGAESPQSRNDSIVNIDITPASEETASMEILEIKEPVTVKKVVDGDTFWAVFSDGSEKKVRLIGVDTPESVHSDETRNTEEGVEASNYTKSILTQDSTVYLEYDVDPTDDYDRVLAYVYLEDGRMLQDILISEGYARLMTIQPNVKYAEHFTKLERAAVENGVGFWSSYFKEE